MADIHIVREHKLGLAHARKLAFRWAEVAEEKMEMECTYEEGKTSDLVRFERPGASGTLQVTKDHFTLDAELGMLLGMFRSKIEGEIEKNLDSLLAEKDALKAFEHGLAQHEAKKKAPARQPAAKKTPAKKK